MLKEHDWLAAHFSETRPRAVAQLTRQFRNFEIAEEAFDAACLNALRTWPEAGVPSAPYSWLMLAAKNAGIDILRRKATASRALHLEVEELGPNVSVEPVDPDEVRDDVLRLLFICCHPSLSVQDQCGIALRIVIGLSVDQVARCFVVQPKAMERRLTRARTIVASNVVPFATPSLRERRERLTSVLLMLYVMFNEGWTRPSSDGALKWKLCHESIRLCRLLLGLFPSTPELLGLLSLFLLQHARRGARFADGRLVRLSDQDRGKWDAGETSEGIILLHKALRHGIPGPYQIQAAIAGVRAQSATEDDMDLKELRRLYRALLAFEPTPVVQLNYAAVEAKIEGPGAGLALIEPLAGVLDKYQWFHSMHGSLLMEIGAMTDALAAFNRALALARTEAERDAIRTNIALVRSHATFGASGSPVPN